MVVGKEDMEKKRLKEGYINYDMEQIFGHWHNVFQTKKKLFLFI